MSNDQPDLLISLASLDGLALAPTVKFQDLRQHLLLGSTDEASVQTVDHANQTLFANHLMSLLPLSQEALQELTMKVSESSRRMQTIFSQPRLPAISSATR